MILMIRKIEVKNMSNNNNNKNDYENTKEMIKNIHVRYFVLILKDTLSPLPMTNFRWAQCKDFCRKRKRVKKKEGRKKEKRKAER